MRRFVWVVGIVALFIPLALSFGADTPSEATPDQLAVIAQLNAHRLGLGLHPLSLNGTLDFLAKKQAEFGQAQNFEPPNYDWHKDANGEYPRQRGVRAGWSTYGGSPEQIEIGENAGLGSLNFSMDYWRTSDVHRRTMENPIYREVGVWAIPHPYGFLYMVVFGARPSVLPVPFNPITCQLYIPRDYRTSGSGVWIKQVETIQFFTQDNQPITAPMAYQSPILLPRNAPPVFTVAMVEANIEVRQTVTLEEDIVILPQTLDILLGRVANTHNCTDPAVVVDTVIPTPIVLEVTATPAELEVAVAPTFTPTSVRQSSEVTYPTSTATFSSRAASEITYPTGTPQITTFLATPTLGAFIATPTAIAPATIGYPANQPSVFPAVPSVLATVVVSAGSNLHCREYPFPTARSLALMPNGTQLLIIGIPGARDGNGQLGGFRDAPTLPITDFSLILEEDVTVSYFTSADIPITGLWLYAEWWNAGSRAGCWVNAGYLSLQYRQAYFTNFLHYLDLVDQGILTLVPYNVPGALFLDF